ALRAAPPASGRGARLVRILAVDPAQTRAHRRNARSRSRHCTREAEMTTVSRLLCFGFGYTALTLARRLAAAGWVATGTCRTPEQAAVLQEAGFRADLFDRDRPLSMSFL